MQGLVQKIACSFWHAKNLFVDSHEASGEQIKPPKGAAT